MQDVKPAGTDVTSIKIISLVCNMTVTLLKCENYHHCTKCLLVSVAALVLVLDLGSRILLNNRIGTLLYVAAKHRRVGQNLCRK